MSRSRCWCFTLNNFTENELDTISAIECKYLIYGMEHMNDPELTPHLQGYIIFEWQKSLNRVKKYIPRAHWEIAKGNHTQNIEYCSKEDKNPFIKGIRPIDYKRKPDAKEILKNDEINGQKRLQTQRTLYGFELEKEMFKEILHNELIKPIIVYIYGDSGVGKTYWALQDALVTYGWNNVATIRFDKSGFAHCNDPQKDCLVWMEFRPSCLDAVSFLELTDGYGCHLNVKHGSMFIRPKCIYICSILPPESIYKEEINEQFKRRITRLVNKNSNPYVNNVDVTTEEANPDDFISD